MLKELVIENFAIIQHLEVSFQPGLNVLTGETGAGKSILVGAVNLILGGRAAQEMIRTGVQEAIVEGVFSIPSSDLLKFAIEDLGLETSDTLVIRRAINRSGRNRVYLNDQSVSLQQLHQVTRGLISISGQHEHQLLLDPDGHLGMLDAFGKTEGLCREVKVAHDEWSRCREALHKLRRFRGEEAARLEWIRFQLNELESANLVAGEDLELEQERNLLRHAETLLDAAQSAHQSLYAGKGSILEQLVEVEKRLETLRRIDPGQEHLVQHYEQARIHLEELSHSLQQYAGRVSFDPQRLSRVEERLGLIHRLSKKYGENVEKMLHRLSELKESVATGESVDQREAELAKTLEKRVQEYVKKATVLSGVRKEAARRLQDEVERTLALLDMPHARFKVDFIGAGDASEAPEVLFAPTGLDRVEFLLTANPGEAFKPLARIASGGELSRILLALKSLLSRQGEAETLIFDEVDSGIGGRTAELVGLQLKRLASKHQVICITHLPQIACYGETHFKVSKVSRKDDTTTSIHELPAEERVHELARMLGGISISPKTLEHAAELLEHGQRGKFS
ncbi:MAG: DNA repair protein RecN [Deltaproteobacteria bacterium]|nr:DNA repair protein RecN [Deltaproteobacteria bacterium]